MPLNYFGFQQSIPPTMLTHNYTSALLDGNTITAEYYLIQPYVKKTYCTHYKFISPPKTYILILNCVKGDFFSKCNVDADCLDSSCCHNKCKRMSNGKHERTGL